MKNILVTGGFGFIGGHLIERLVEDQNNLVYVVDDLSSCPIPFRDLLDEFGDPANLMYEISTISKFCTPNPLMTKQRRSYCHYYDHYDEIYHLASPVGPAGVLKHAGNMIGMVVGDIYHLMELALRDGAKLVDVSTSEVYGGGDQGLCAEHMDKIVPAETTIRLEYAIAKLAAETAIINTCKVKPLRAAIVRPFNVAGPRQSGEGGFVLPRFIEQAMNGECLTVFGDGTQMRAFTHVEDIVDGLIAVMERGGMKGDVYNLGNPANKTTINDLADGVNRIVCDDDGVVHVDPKAIYGELYAEAAEKFPDATKATKMLGWVPRHGILRTIEDAYKYMLSHRDVEVE